jgi:3-methyladenine DNA glycosylase AlkD
MHKPLKHVDWSAVRLARLRRQFEQHADPVHAEFHREYHKSSLRFYGLRTPQFKQIFQDVFPRSETLNKEAGLSLTRQLWASAWAEERLAALALLERMLPQLQAADLPLLRSIADSCEGWGQTDMLSLRVLGPLALREADEIYRSVRAWTRAEHMWTRRAAILIHILPARKARLQPEYAWSSFEELLGEKEFFIRKAIGWTLRECSKHYPAEVCEFLLRVGERASALTRREGARNLPTAMRIRVLGK